ncbi:MAG: kinase/pyrophosphorylase [Anaerolineales bacterium]|nr:kinase/pyrophosphorylase [Anaerolineales bacterium]
MFRKVYVISDATGNTAKRVLEAALTQFDTPGVEVVQVGNVRAVEQIRLIVAQVAAEEGFIVHTLVSEELRYTMLDEGRRYKVATIDLMGPLLLRISDWLSSQPKAKPGLFRSFDREYDRRIEAIEFTVQHDDGQRIEELHLAELVLVGISRASKTPLSIYLANHGWKVANVPIMLGIEPPPLLFKLPRRKVIALYIKPERLANLRQVRVDRMGTSVAWGYADLEHIRQEVTYAYEIYDRRRDWPLIDVTNKPIEETAAEVMAIMRKAGNRKL